MLAPAVTAAEWAIAMSGPWAKAAHSIAVYVNQFCVPVNTTRDVKTFGCLSEMLAQTKDYWEGLVGRLTSTQT